MRGLVTKFVMIFVLAVSSALLGARIGLDRHQALAVAIFVASISGTLFFWEFRLSFAFLGTCVLILTNTISLERLITYASLDVILFLAGMMIVVGLLKYVGFFAWIVELILRMRRLTARRFVVVITFVSAVLSAATGEVVSIIFMVAAILEICDYFETDPLPYILISVFATNIGSAATVLGNPIGILIASKSGLTSEDFLLKAMPLSVVCLGVMLGVVLLWYRKVFDAFDKKVKELGTNEILIRLISVPLGRELKAALGLMAATMLLITLSHRLEILLRLENNAVLMTVPLAMAAVVMIWKRHRAREFVEKDVEWWSLLFFLMLFAQAGTLKYTGATDVFAKGLMDMAHGSSVTLIGVILWVGAIGSSLMDNVVIVVAFIPIVKSFHALGGAMESFWWALLFGGCLGGNITLIGSTANIIAVGVLEKEKGIRVNFFNWLLIGSIVGVATTACAWGALWLARH